ncbi:MAG: SIMPL domain-containing protein [Paracoccus sp. (in: a-proteobacteria)]|nr:SIMPL domain-containing protein [Paracoccus sp. (in: a-proteobacteria)]
MTRLLQSAALVALTAAAAGPALANTGMGPGMGHGAHAAMMQGCTMGRLSVTGEGTARVAPDLAQISLGVTTQADTAAGAMSENSEKQTAVMQALLGSGVVEEDIQTSGLMLTPLINYSDEAGPVMTGYQAQNMVTVRVSDLAELGNVLDAIVQAGANEVNGISFTRENSESAQDQARTAAVEDAQHRAEVMARAAGQRLGPILSMGEPEMPPMGPEPMMMRMEASAADSRAVPVAAGEISLLSRVSMVYALLPAEGACAMPGQDAPVETGADASEATTATDAAETDQAPSSAN